MSHNYFQLQQRDILKKQCRYIKFIKLLTVVLNNEKEKLEDSLIFFGNNNSNMNYERKEFVCVCVKIS